MRPASLMAHVVKNLPAMWEMWVNPWVGKIPWRREQLSTPVFWPGEFHGQRSLAGYSSWGHKEPDRTGNFHFQPHDCPSFLVGECFPGCSVKRKNPGRDCRTLCTEKTRRAESPGRPRSLKFSGQSNEERELHKHRTPRPAGIQP